jgi:hypothetical protein
MQVCENDSVKQVCAKLTLKKSEADFYEYSHFHNSGEYECKFRPLRQNLGKQNLRLQNSHHNTNFCESIRTVHILINFSFPSLLLDNFV